MITKKYNILAIHSGKREDPGPCELYRVTTPMAYLNKRPAWNCRWMPFDLFHENHLQQNAELGTEIIAKNFDMIVWARSSLHGSEQAFKSAAWTVNRFRELGLKQVYEIDDDYTEKHRKVLNGGHSTEFASWCDAITVTTPYLAETMYRETKRPVYILPNMLDPQFWFVEPQNKLEDGNIYITLSGSPTHVEDWRVLGGVLQRLAEDYPYVRFIIGAFHPDYLRGIKNAAYLPGIPYVQYIDLIKNSDIVLCPVDPNDYFNLGKSPIKATEGQGATRIVDDEKMGAAVIATDNPIYRLAIPNEKFGVLVKHTPEAWEAALRELITNTAKRRSLQREGYKFVTKRFNLETGWMEWARTYQRIFAKNTNTQKIDYVKSFTTYRELAGLSDGAA